MPIEVIPAYPKEPADTHLAVEPGKNLPIVDYAPDGTRTLVVHCNEDDSGGAILEFCGDVECQLEEDGSVPQYLLKRGKLSPINYGEEHTEEIICPRLKLRGRTVMRHSVKVCEVDSEL